MKKQKKNQRKSRAQAPKLSCPFNNNPDLISYKDVYKLKKFISTRGRLMSPDKTGVSTRCQRKLAKEIKKARYMALLPFTEYV